MKNIDVLVRALIVQGGKILVCRKVNKKYYFLPGGHVDFGESLEKALKRELFEELGLKIKKSYFIGGSEHLFREDGKKFHEINFVFKTMVNEVETKSKEDHLQFFLLDKKQFSKEKVLPTILQKAILKWLKTKKLFWVSGIK